MLGLVASLLTGCSEAPREKWRSTREACQLWDGETIPYPSEGPPDPGAPLLYDETCAEAIADDLGVAWIDFPGANLPGTLAGDPIERFVAGGWLILAGDFGSVSEVVGDDAVPASFLTDIEEYVDEFDLLEESPASQLLYNYVTNEVETTLQGADDAPLMRWWSDTLVLPALSEEEGTTAFDTAATLLHEASHADHTRSHVHCDAPVNDEGSLDATWDSATGIAMYGLLLLLPRLPEEDDRNLPGHVVSRLNSDNFSICDPTDIPEYLNDIER